MNSKQLTEANPDIVWEGQTVHYITRERVRAGKGIVTGVVAGAVYTAHSKVGKRELLLIQIQGQRGYVSASEVFVTKLDAKRYAQALSHREWEQEIIRHKKLMGRITSAAKLINDFQEI